MNVDVVILGGGVSGLSFAHYLQRFNPALSYILIEPKERVGGWIKTETLPSGQIYETGPRCFRLRGKTGAITAELLVSLGLQSEIVRSSPLTNKRYVVLEGSPQELPYSFGSLVKTPIGRHLVATALKEPFRQTQADGDESVASFFSRRCNSSLVDKLADALVSGIWGGDPSQLSLQATFPELAQYERQYGSCLIGAIISMFSKTRPVISGICTLKQGLSQFVSALHSSLHAPVVCNTKVLSIDTTSQELVLHTSAGKICTKRIVCALPGQELPNLVSLEIFGKQIPHVPHASFATVVMGWKEEQSFRQGFGVLAPSTEDTQVLGIVHDSSVFPELSSQMKSRLTVILGGARWQRVLSHSDSELYKLAFERVNRWMGTAHRPSEFAVFRSPHSIPQPPVGIGINSSYFESSCQRIFAINSSIGGVSMNQCVFSAHTLAAKFSAMKR